MQKRWKVKTYDPQKSEEIAHALNIPEMLGRLLIQRNITNFKLAKKFFRPQLDELHDPFLMKNMDLAVSRLQKAIDEKQKIMIYGVESA
mgnify:CR=1 FL=1